jgi:hypothetical protein
VDARQSRALAHVNLSGPGLEIGPSYLPLVPRHQWAKVETVDHASRAELIAKYRDHGLAQEELDRIEDVDHIWTGGSLVTAVGKSEYYEYVVAAHAIEHSVDLVGFVQDCQTLLRPGGRLALVVPDKRTCFDWFKPLTSVGAVVDAHLRPTMFHTPGVLLDHYAYACTLDDRIVWAPGETGQLSTQFADLSAAHDAIQTGIDQQTYRDAHRWVFTPASFSLLIEDLAELGYHSFCEVGSAPTAGFEFYVTLGKATESRDREPRIDRLLRIQAELSDDALRPEPLAGALAQARKEVEALRASTSWRITAPLRALSDRLRRRAAETE